MTINKGSSRLLNGMLLLTAIVGGGLFVRVARRADTSTAAAADPVPAEAAQRQVCNERPRHCGGDGNAGGRPVLSRQCVRTGCGAGRSGDVVRPPRGRAVGPAGRLVDRVGPQRMAVAGLVAMRLGAFTLPRLSAGLGLPGYVSALAFSVAGAFVLTALVIAVRSSAAA